MNDRIATVFIYTLSDPETKEVRYVGKAIDLNGRLHGHLHDKSETHKAHWIASLRKKGLKPGIEPVETLFDTTDDEWQECERFWIETLRFYGCRLTNNDSGGIGGRRPSLETRLKISRKHLGKTISEEVKLKVSKFHKGRKKSPLELQHIREAARLRSGNMEWRKKVGEFHKGRKRSPETVARIRKAARSRPPEFYRNIREKLKNPSLETLARMSAASHGRNKGVPRPEWVRAKIARATRLAWRKKKTETIK